MNTNTKSQQNIGTIIAIVSYVIWGFLPMFWKLLDSVDPFYILANRIIWSLIFVGAYILFAGKSSELKSALKDKSLIFNNLLSGIFITINWGTYILAINTNHVLESSLGYFIEPIIVVFIGFVLFKETISKLKFVTVGFSVLSMFFMLLMARSIPIISLMLAFSFAAYGMIKKKMELSTYTSMFLETMCISPIAIGYIVFSHIKYGNDVILGIAGAQYLLFPMSGFVTLMPLLLFAYAVRRMPYHLAGIVGYISPSINFMLGVLLYNEPMDTNRLIAFVIIWVGIMFTIVDSFIEGKKNKIQKL